MEPKRFFQSNLLKALIFFCFGFVVLEPMDTALWILSGVFISLAFFEKTDFVKSLVGTYKVTEDKRIERLCRQAKLDDAKK